MAKHYAITIKIKKTSTADVGLPNSLVLLPTRPHHSVLTMINVSRRIVGDNNARRLKAFLVSLLYGLLAALLITTNTYADSPTAKKYYNINLPQQNAADALNLLAEQTGVTFLFPYNVAETRQANPVVGRFTLMKALQLLLQDSDLSGGLTESGVVIISLKERSKNGEGMGMKSKKNLLAATVAFFVGGGVASSGVAQGQDSGIDESSGFQLEEIVVTASRREKSLNDTAISVAAVGGEEISRRNLSEMNDYLRTIPGVTFIDQGVAANTVVVRGLSVDPELEALISGPTVGVYFGEVPLSGLSALGTTSDIKMIDLERVEVLRGPQGTLFGSGALGGAVRNIPNKPDLSELNGSIKTTYSETSGEGGENTKIEGVINIPIVEDVFAVRLVAYRHDTSGYVKNIAGTQLATDGVIAIGATAGGAVAQYGGADLYKDKGDVGNTVHEGGRLSLLWSPTEDLSVSFQYLDQEAEQEGLPFVQLNTGGYTQVALDFGDNVAVLAGKDEGLEDDVSISNLVLEYDLGWGDVMSSSAWSNNDNARRYETSSFIGGGPLAQEALRENETFIQEIRLASKLEGDFQFIIGAYYEDIDVETISDRVYGTAENPDLLPGFVKPPGSPDPLVNPLLNAATDFVETDQTAIYGELSYDMTDQVTLTLGARRYDYEREAGRDDEGFLGNSLNVNKFDDSGTNLKFNVSYRPNDDTLLYLERSEGFRLGNTINPRPPSSICDVNNDGLLDGTNAPIVDGFGSDTTENLELGGKFSLLDSRLQINAALFRVDWQDIPLRVSAGKLESQVDRICFTSTVANAGEARSEGFEIETVYQLSEAFAINVGGSYTDVYLTEDFPADGASDGDRLPSSPDYNINLGLQYDFSLAGYPSYLLADYAYISEFYNKIGENGDKGGDYGQVNVNAGINLGDFTLELFAQNLTDEDAITSVGVLEPDTRAYRLRPRTIGLNVGYQF